MMSIEEAIVEKLRESGPCCLDDVVTSLANFSWGEVSSAVDVCRETDGCYFAKAVTRAISFHLAHSLPTLCTPTQHLVSRDRQPDT